MNLKFISHNSKLKVDCFFYSTFCNDYLLIFGRQKIIMVGLFVLGITYALFAVVTNPITFIINRFIYGSAWGTIIVIYYLTVIGDLSTKGSTERYYTIGGVIPLVLVMFSSFLSSVFRIYESATVVSTILSVLIFISAIILMMAEETLPPEIQTKRKRDEHLEQLKKLVDKDSKT